MAKLKKVIIVGGGVGGLTTALALRRAGVEVEVHEKHQNLQQHATGFTIWSYAIKHLISLGLEKHVLDSFGGELENTEIRNQEGRLLELMPVGEVSRKLGAPSYDMLRSGLLGTLVDRIGDDNAVRMNSECVGVEQDGETAAAILADGSRAAGDLLIGADGIHSVVRNAVASKSNLRYSGYSAVAAVIQFTHPLLSKGHHVEIWGKGAKAGVADVGNGQIRWYVTHKVPAGRDSRTGKKEILERIKGWYELLISAVDSTEDSQLVHTEAWDLEPIKTWVKGRVVLLGDAAHATTPFAAMGANITIEDSTRLVELLASELSLDDALKAFQEHRKKRTEDVVKKSRMMAKITQIHSPILAWLRDQAFLHIPPEKMEQVAREMASGEG